MLSARNCDNPLTGRQQLQNIDDPKTEDYPKTEDNLKSDDELEIKMTHKMRKKWKW